MTTSVREAGTAAPTPAAAELPRHEITDVWGDCLRVRCTNTVDPFPRAFVHVEGPESDVMCEWLLTPERARQLAVYLVDCANALDNPAQRVIVDDPNPSGWAADLGALQRGDIELLEDAVQALELCGPDNMDTIELARQHALDGLRQRLDAAYLADACEGIGHE